MKNARTSVSTSRASARLPVLELRYGYFGIEGAMGAQRRGRIDMRLGSLDPALNGTLPYLFALLRIQDTPNPLRRSLPSLRTSMGFARSEFMRYSRGLLIENERRRDGLQWRFKSKNAGSVEPVWM
jgi:hypothetical protein